MKKFVILILVLLTSQLLSCKSTETASTEVIHNVSHLYFDDLYPYYKDILIESESDIFSINDEMRSLVKNKIKGSNNFKEQVNKLVDEINMNEGKMAEVDSTGGTKMGYEEFKKLEKRNEAIKKALAAAQKIYEDLEMQYANLKKEMRAVEDENDSLKQLQKECEEEVAKLKEEIATLQSQKTQLQEDIANSKEEYKKLQDSFNALEKNSNSEIAANSEKSRSLWHLTLFIVYSSHLCLKQ